MRCGVRIAAARRFDCPGSTHTGRRFSALGVRDQALAVGTNHPQSSRPRPRPQPPPAGYLLSLAVHDPRDPRDGLLRMGQGILQLAYRATTDEVVELYRDEPMLAVSTENNISAWFFLHQLADLTREARWVEAAERIRRGLLQSALFGSASPSGAKPWLNCPNESFQALCSKHGDASGYR